MAISVNTSGKDFDSILDSLIDFATIQYGQGASSARVWSDFNLSSFSRNWAELVAYTGDQLMFYMDTQANQAYLRSATIPSFVIDIANQLGYVVPTQQAASGKVQLTFGGPVQVAAFYPVFAGNTQFITTRAVIANQAGSIEVDAIQGARFTEAFTADGIQNESFTLIETDIVVDLTNPNPELRSPIVVVNGTTYNVVPSLVDSAPNSTDVVRKELPDGRTRLIFGDGIFGRRLVENESVNVIYRNQGGTQGNVEAGEIDTLGVAITNLLSVTNATPFSGGVDRLTLQQIKDRVPLSLKTVAGAVSLPDFADILIANFPQVLTANAAVNTIQSGIDLDIYVLPNSESVTNITDNSLLFNTLTDFVERRKVVGTQFLIKNAAGINMAISIEAYLNSDASRASVESDIREQVSALFDLQTGGSDGNGVGFAELVQISDLFDVLRGISGLARFEIKLHTVTPRVDVQKSSINQDFYVSKVDTYEGVDNNEWLVVTSEVANPEPSNGQVKYKVFKRTLGNVTSLAQDSITDTNLDLTVHQGQGIVTGSTTITDANSVFTANQYDNFTLVDASSNIWRIVETKSGSVRVSSPALNDGAVTSVPSGAYRIVKSFSGEMIGINNASFTLLYNTHNTFFSPGASFDLIATIKTPFILSQEQTNTGTYGVPVSVAAVTPEGPNPGDLVEVTFNSNPNLSSVDSTYTLVDSLGVVFDVSNVDGNDTPVASYNNPALIDSSITLTDTGNDQSVSIAFQPAREVNNSFLEVTVSLEKVDSPLGSIFVEIRADNGSGSPGAVIQASNPVSTAVLSAGMSTISFNFPSSMTLSMSSNYHLTVQGDSAYKTSYASAIGLVKVGIDTTTLEYSPAQTAAGAVRLNSVNLDVQSTATGSIKVTNNFIRSTKQATLLVKLMNNASFTTGTNQITIGGQPFLAVSGTPTAGQFQVGADITATRNNLKAAINAEMTGIVAGADSGADAIFITADSTNYKGELGNLISVDIIDQGTQNFDVGGVDSLVGGVNGDKIEIVAPQFLNSGLVGYTYTSGTGVIQFAGAVSLPAFQAGDKFKDGAGNLFDILSINDGLNTVTIATGQTISNTVSTQLSGSVYRTFTYIFGENVTAGATVDLTAAALAAAINPQPYLNAAAATDTVNLTAGLAGNDGNSITMSKDDAGQNNFTLSGTSLTGGLDGDVFAIAGVEFTPVLSAPSTNGQFQIDIGSLNNTLANLENRINIHPSLVGVVNAAVETSSRSVQIASSVIGTVGNSITLAVTNDSSGEITVSGPTLVGGEDNKLVKFYNGAVWADRAPDSDLIFFIGVASDKLTVISKADANGDQVIPTLSVNGNFDAGIGKRYYSDNSEVSFIIATRSPNSFILGGENVDIFGRGVNSGSQVRVDQFVFRTSTLEGDVTNLRPNEIPVLTDSNLKVNLLGGVS